MSRVHGKVPSNTLCRTMAVRTLMSDSDQTAVDQGSFGSTSIQRLQSLISSTGTGLISRSHALKYPNCKNLLSFQSTAWCKIIMVSHHQEIVSEPQFSAVSCSMMVVALIFLFLRIGLQTWSWKMMEVQDFLIYLAFVSFLTFSICYLVLVPRIYEVQRVALDIIDLWPSMKRDIAIYVRMMFVTTSLFWISLWSVKLSFLALYGKLLQGLPMLFTRLWSALLALCLLVRCLR